jgi:chaperonin GroEL (HSP60 family)
MPLRKIAENAGQDGAVVANKVKKEKKTSHGYDALNDNYGDMFDFGVVDPAKVVRSSLQNAVSVASLWTNRLQKKAETTITMTTTEWAEWAAACRVWVACRAWAEWVACQA